MKRLTSALDGAEFFATASTSMLPTFAIRVLEAAARIQIDL